MNQLHNFLQLIYSSYSVLLLIFLLFSLSPYKDRNGTEFHLFFFSFFFTILLFGLYLSIPYYSLLSFFIFVWISIYSLFPQLVNLHFSFFQRFSFRIRKITDKGNRRKEKFSIITLYRKVPSEVMEARITSKASYDLGF